MGPGLQQVGQGLMNLGQGIAQYRQAHQRINQIEDTDELYKAGRQFIENDLIKRFNDDLFGRTEDPVVTDGSTRALEPISTDSYLELFDRYMGEQVAALSGSNLNTADRSQYERALQEVSRQQRDQLAGVLQSSAVRATTVRLEQFRDRLQKDSSLTTEERAARFAEGIRPFVDQRIIDAGQAEQFVKAATDHFRWEEIAAIALNDQLSPSHRRGHVERAYQTWASEQQYRALMSMIGTEREATPTQYYNSHIRPSGDQLISAMTASGRAVLGNNSEALAPAFQAFVRRANEAFSDGSISPEQLRQLAAQSHLPDQFATDFVNHFMGVLASSEDLQHAVGVVANARTDEEYRPMVGSLFAGANVEDDLRRSTADYNAMQNRRVQEVMDAYVAGNIDRANELLSTPLNGASVVIDDAFRRRIIREMHDHERFSDSVYGSLRHIEGPAGEWARQQYIQAITEEFGGIGALFDKSITREQRNQIARGILDAATAGITFGSLGVSTRYGNTREWTTRQETVDGFGVQVSSRQITTNSRPTLQVDIQAMRQAEALLDTSVDTLGRGGDQRSFRAAVDTNILKTLLEQTRQFVTTRNGSTQFVNRADLRRFVESRVDASLTVPAEGRGNEQRRQNMRNAAVEATMAQYELIDFQRRALDSRHENDTVSWRPVVPIEKQEIVRFNGTFAIHEVGTENYYRAQMTEDNQVVIQQYNTHRGDWITYTDPSRGRQVPSPPPPVHPPTRASVTPSGVEGR